MIEQEPFVSERERRLAPFEQQMREWMHQKADQMGLEELHNALAYDYFGMRRRYVKPQNDFERDTWRLAEEVGRAEG